MKTLILLFCMVIWLFMILWYTNEKAMDKHLLSVSEFCLITTDEYAMQECRIYNERQNDCEIEKQEVWGWEWLERCLADVAMTKYNIINIMR